MFDPADTDEAGDASALEDYLAYREQIESVAKNLVEQVKRMIETREALQPRAGAAFLRLHSAWYTAIEGDFASLGFTILGDFEDANSASVSVDKRSFYRFALSGDRTTAACWFIVPSVPELNCVVMESWSATGARCVTASGVVDSGLPLIPTTSTKRFPQGTPLKQMLADHRGAQGRFAAASRQLTGIEQILQQRHADAEELGGFRKELGLDLFEPMLRAMMGDRFDEEGTDILGMIHEHPEWWTGEEVQKGDDESWTMDADDAPPFMMLMSRDDETGRGHITTHGLGSLGIPELQMKAFAGNHFRGARLITNAVARKLIGTRAGDLPAEQLSGIHVTLTSEETGIPVGTGASVVVRLEFEPFSNEDLEDNDSVRLLSIKPVVDVRSGVDEWLMASCRQLGLEIPAPLPSSALQHTMKAASRRAVTDIQQLRQQVTAGLPGGRVVGIKMGLDTRDGGKEYVWVKVTGWSGGMIVGTLESQPYDCPGFTLGQRMEVPESSVYDRVVYSETEGIVEAGLTDVVAQDFGVDLPG